MQGGWRPEGCPNSNGHIALVTKFLVVLLRDKVFRGRWVGFLDAGCWRCVEFTYRISDYDRPGPRPRPRPKFAQNQPGFYITLFLKCTSLY